mgnify:FL=1|jgi:hypothetical protein
MSKWKLVLNKEIGLVDLETFNTKKQAEEAIKYRTSLTRHLGYEPDLTYEIVEVKRKER